MSEEILSSLVEYLGNRNLDVELSDYIKSNSKQITGTKFRGMSLPLAFLKEGYDIEEWYGSCHFSDSLKTALSFSTNFNEEFEKDLIETYGAENGALRPIILTCDDLFGFSVYDALIALNEACECPVKDSYLFLLEQEIITIGYNFRIKEIKKIRIDEIKSYSQLTVKDKELEFIYFVDVEPLNKNRFKLN